MLAKTALFPLVGFAVLIISLGNPAFGQNGSSPAAETTARGSKDSSSHRSTEWFEAKTQAQQEEMDALRARIEKLEAMLAALAGDSQNRHSLSTGAARREGGQAAYGENGDGVATATMPTAVAAAGPPLSPVSSHNGGGEVTPRELLPDIGHIGAQVGLLTGVTQNPFGAKRGFLGGGFIDLPLRKLPSVGGKLSYEILVSLQRAKSNQTTTSGVIALVNNALNDALSTGVTGLPRLLTPLPVTNPVRERMTVLTVVPVAFKYTLTSLDRFRFRPYGVVGLGTYVTLSTQNNVNFTAAQPGVPAALVPLLNALLQGPQVAGLVPIAPELRARGVAAGQGDFRFGVHYGGGFEFRITPRSSIGLDVRLNKIEGHGGGTYTTVAPKFGVHF